MNEESKIIKTIEQICSVCLSNNTILISTKSSFSTNVEVPITAMFKIFTNFENYDNLLDKICITCAQQLKFSHDFYIKCLSTFSTLNSALLASKNDSSIFIVNKEELSSSKLLPTIAPNNPKNNVEILGARQKFGEKMISCQQCDKKFKTKRGLTYHQLNHNKDDLEIANTNKDSFECHVCDRKFDQKFNWINHNKNHFEALCYFCNHGFLNNGQMMEHVNEQHKTNKYFQCFYCKKQYSKRKILLKHERNVHKVLKRLYFCGICEKNIGFTTRNFLKLHIERNHKMIEKRPQSLTDQLDQFDDENMDDSTVDGTINFGNDPIEKQAIDSIEEFDQFLFLNTDQKPIGDELLVNETDSYELEFPPQGEYCDNLCDPSILDLDPDELEFEEGMIKITNVSDKPQSQTTKKISSENDLKNNDNPDMMQLRYKCPKCLDKFERQFDLTNHLAHVHNEKCLICNQCGMAFNQCIDFDAHRQEHKREENLDLYQTDDELSQQANGILNYETINEDGFIHHLCKLCGKKFVRKVNLHKHNCDFYKNENLQIPCNECNATFTSIPEMFQHRRMHVSNNSVCSLCDKKFSTITGLKYHLKTHTGIKSFTCPFCSRKFTANTNLNAHIRVVHSEIKPYSCDKCFMTFATHDHLKKHTMSKHLGHKNFMCDTCGKQYYQQSHLTYHIWVHTGIKPHSCELCSSAYTTKASLKKHMLKIHHINDFH